MTALLPSVLTPNPDSSDQETNALAAPARKVRSLRTQLLLAVNLPLALLVAVFAVYDFRSSLDSRLIEKGTALEEEAKTLLPAVVQLQSRGVDVVQRYVDSVCARMQSTQSPGHHIVVELSDSKPIVQANAHGKLSAEALAALQLSVLQRKSQFDADGQILLVGAESQDGTTVFVSESLSETRDAVFAEVMRRVVAILMLAAVAAVVASAFLRRVVSQPLERLATTIQDVESGRLGCQTQPFRTVEMNRVATAFNSMSTALANSDAERRRQMAKARAIQFNLLPTELEAGNTRCTYVYQPADDVGGDYFDAISLADGTQLFCIADVTGHGVPAAMCAAILKALLLQATGTLVSPAAMLKYINRHLTAITLVEDFVSMVLVRIEPQNLRTHYANAGHEPALLARQDQQIGRLESTGGLLGLSNEAEWDEITLEICSGDRLFIATDGVTEATNEKLHCFGRGRLEELLNDVASLDLTAATSRIWDAISAHRGSAHQQDDITFLFLEFLRCSRAGDCTTGHHRQRSLVGFSSDTAPRR